MRSVWFQDFMVSTRVVKYFSKQEDWHNPLKNYIRSRHFSFQLIFISLRVKAKKSLQGPTKCDRILGPSPPWPTCCLISLYSLSLTQLQLHLLLAAPLAHLQARSRFQCAPTLGPLRWPPFSLPRTHLHHFSTWLTLSSLHCLLRWHRIREALTDHLPM